MLANLLPGLRELRTPLAVGWTWLVVLWVALGSSIPTDRSGIGLVQSLLDATSFLGKTVVLGVLAFVAYLLGSLMQRDNAERSVFDNTPRGIFWRRFHRRVVRPLTRRYYPVSVSLSRWPIWELHAYVKRAVPGNLPSKGAPEDAPPESKWPLQKLTELVLEEEPDEVRRRDMAEIFEDEMDRLFDFAASAVLRQKTQLETRLLADKRDVYDYYDRLKESAELRTNLALPVLVLGIAISGRLLVDEQPVWAWLLATVVGGFAGFALIVRGRAQYHRSRAALATAVATNLVKSPLLEEWQRRYSAAPKGVPAETIHASSYPL
jgi:hypothetical protein